MKIKQNDPQSSSNNDNQTKLLEALSLQSRLITFDEADMKVIRRILPVVLKCLPLGIQIAIFDASLDGAFAPFKEVQDSAPKKECCLKCGFAKTVDANDSAAFKKQYTCHCEDKKATKSNKKN